MRLRVGPSVLLVVLAGIPLHPAVPAAILTPPRFPSRSCQPFNPAVAAVQPAAGERTFKVAVKRYEYTPRRIEVTEGDLVRIELRTEDIAHSLTIDEYRVSKRVEAGMSAVLEFRADRAGTFPFYCNLRIDDGCRKVRGELIVRPRRGAATPSRSN